jgi:hypothetical protein
MDLEVCGMLYENTPSFCERTIDRKGFDMLKLKLAMLAAAALTVLPLVSGYAEARSKCGSQRNPCRIYVQPVHQAAPVTVTNNIPAPPAPVVAKDDEAGKPDARVRSDTAVWGEEAGVTMSVTVGKKNPSPAPAAAAPAQAPQ